MMDAVEAEANAQVAKNDWRIREEERQRLHRREQEPALDRERRERRSWAKVAGLGLAASLLLLLSGQTVHRYRQSLVAKPWLERPMQSLYSVFGVTLEPKWDLRAYDLRQLGSEELQGNAGRIELRATVHNCSLNTQPPPLIRVVLRDRFGNALSTTAVAPADYLQRAPPARMAPDQRLDAMLTLDDPTRQAVGFELDDVCLPGTDGRLHCSNDP